MTGLTHDQRRCIAHTVLRQGYHSVATEGLNAAYWPKPSVPIPDPALLTACVTQWHQQIIHLAELAEAS